MWADWEGKSLGGYSFAASHAAVWPRGPVAATAPPALPLHVPHYWPPPSPTPAPGPARADMMAMGCVVRKDGAPLLRRRVVSTASLYFRWFYADGSFADTDPRALSLAALFLASKVEEMPVHAKGLMHTATTLGAGARWHAPAALPAVLTAEAQLVVRGTGNQEKDASVPPSCWWDGGVILGGLGASTSAR